MFKAITRNVFFGLTLLITPQAAADVGGFCDRPLEAESLVPRTNIRADGQKTSVSCRLSKGITHQFYVGIDPVKWFFGMLSESGGKFAGTQFFEVDGRVWLLGRMTDKNGEAGETLKYLYIDAGEYSFEKDGPVRADCETTDAILRTVLAKNK